MTPRERKPRLSHAAIARCKAEGDRKRRPGPVSPTMTVLTTQLE